MEADPRSSSHPVPGPRQARRLQARLLGWYAGNRRDLPWRRTTDPYAVLVSEVMLQQTQVSRVVPRYEEFLAVFPTLEALAGAELCEVLRLWSGLGYNNRAERLHRCASLVVEDAHGRPPLLPTDLDALLRLPGLGPYTARAVLIFAHNADLAAVDANVRRVLTCELGLAADLSDRELGRVAAAVLPHGRSRDWHNALMDYGALVLTGRVTGLSPRRRQTPFVGSRRWQRSRLLRRLLDEGPQSTEALAGGLGLPQEMADELLDDLADDGLVTMADGVARIRTRADPRRP